MSVPQQTLLSMQRSPAAMSRPVRPLASAVGGLALGGGIGFGFRLEIAIVAFAAVWPMLVFPRPRWQASSRSCWRWRALRLPPPAWLAKIVIPFALPRIFVAFRLVAGVALIVAVTVEIAVNPLGLGYGMTMAQQTLRPAEMLAGRDGLGQWILPPARSFRAPDLYAGVVLFGALGYASALLIDLVERRPLRWRG